MASIPPFTPILREKRPIGKYQIQEPRCQFFLKLWMQGSILNNLESMIISTENVYRYPEALAGIERIPWNRNNRAQKFVYRAAFRDFFQKEFDYLDCADAHDIMRNDGKLASIKILSETKAGITRHYFFMFVWNSRFPISEPFQNGEPGLRFL
uniref:Uncharacterized protein n=1 Tax=Caenorhabditis tropicalis TaxID=1561998 RepID=A0A1I7UZT6_9PELO